MAQRRKKDLELEHVRTVSLASHKDYDQEVIVSVAKHRGWKQRDAVSNALYQH